MSGALGFDFDHTLGIDGGLEHEAFVRYAAELGSPLSTADRAAPGAIDAALARARSGAVGIDEAVEAFFAARGIAARGARWREHCFALIPERVRALEGAPELLATLRERGIPFAILTNGWSPLQERKIAQALGDAAVEVLVSDRIGALKPARGAFDALVRVLGVARERVWYVGDNADVDVAGALAAGLRAVWVADGGASYPQNLPAPTLRVGALRELERLIENTKVP